MKIGLYFGSFNPIHVGHLIIANHILNEVEVEKIWFIVSPQNPFKESSSLLNEYHRLHLVQIAIENDARLRASDIEFGLPKPSYTAHTMAYLKEKYPQHSFTIILGSDSFQNLAKWKNADGLVKNYQFLIYKRPGFEVNNEMNAAMRIMDAPLLQISATHIREMIKTGKSIKYLVPQAVEEEISKSGYYKKPTKSNPATGRPQQ